MRPGTKRNPRSRSRDLETGGRDEDHMFPPRWRKRAERDVLVDDYEDGREKGGSNKHAS